MSQTPLLIRFRIDSGIDCAKHMPGERAEDRGVRTGTQGSEGCTLKDDAATYLPGHTWRIIVNFINAAQRCAGVTIAIRYGQTHFLASVCIRFSSQVVFHLPPILSNNTL